MTRGMAHGDPHFAARILGCLSSGILGIDTAGNVALLNEGAQRILGLPQGSPDEAIGHDCRGVLAAQPTVARLLLEVLDGREALSRAELVLEPVGASLGNTIGFTLTPLRDAAEQICGAAMLFRDLTPFERGEEQARLRDRLAALGQMAAGLAHEIRNPLAGMELMAGLLQRRLADRPEERQLVAELIGQLRQLAATVTDSLEFVRPISLERKRIDPRALLETALEQSLARAPHPDAVERRYAPELPALRVDADLMGMALTNLIVNACEAMAGVGAPAGSRLVLALCERAAQRPARAVRVESAGGARPETTAPEREVVISVCDSGPGIPPPLREKIFYPFFTTKPRGSGIGLANVQKIVAAHGGSVALECRPGGGCTFRLHLPVDAERE
ncbi:MAG: ATP-binding protein [Myxococcales bacterium]|nr:ATP-binding protein [Myxococcales bacterium]